REISLEDLKIIQTLRSEQHAALRSPRPLARFLCGIRSPATLRDRLTRHDAFGLLEDMPFRSVLDQLTVWM
ncbi:MAG: hypothetical protein IAE94_13360, partial [Chthoniobacterales bacterium]|nr:hypothetical protein [Chthoniobacterales bacterium]